MEWRHSVPRILVDIMCQEGKGRHKCKRTDKASYKEDLSGVLYLSLKTALQGLERKYKG